MTWSAVIPSGIWKIPLESAHPWASLVQFSISSSASSRSLNQETVSICCGWIGFSQGGIGRLVLSPKYARTLGVLTGPLSIYEPPQLRKISIFCETLPALPYGGIRSVMPEYPESTIAHLRKNAYLAWKIVHLQEWRTWGSSTKVNSNDDVLVTSHGGRRNSVWFTNREGTTTCKWN